MEIYHRVAAHQTTADNPGLLPETIVAPLVNFIEVARPLVDTLGPTDLGSGAWSYARVTQHTQVGKQAGEKTELASRKMLITKTPLGADTFGGYVNVSKQDINRTSPGDPRHGHQRPGRAVRHRNRGRGRRRAVGRRHRRPGDPTGPPTGADVATAIWGAAGSGVRRHEGPGPHRRRGVARHARAASARCSRRSTRRTPTRPGSAPPPTQGAQGPSPG